MLYDRDPLIAQSKAATIPNNGQNGILKTDIILPSSEMQKKFLAFVEQTKKTKAEVHQSLEKIETLKDLNTKIFRVICNVR